MPKRFGFPAIDPSLIYDLYFLSRGFHYDRAVFHNGWQLAISQSPDSNFFNVSIDYLVGREDDFGNINIPGQLTDREYDNINDEEKELLKAFRACSEQTKKNIMLLAKNMQSLENRSK